MTIKSGTDTFYVNGSSVKFKAGPVVSELERALMTQYHAVATTEDNEISTAGHHLDTINAAIRSES